MKAVFNIKYMLLLFIQSILFAQPNANTERIINGYVIYQDQRNQSLFYHVPKGLKLIKNLEGKPEFKFIQMRYTGTRAAGDQGSQRFRSLIHFKVAQETMNEAQKDSIKTVLNAKGFTISALRPIPLSNLKAELIHAASNATDSSYAITGGFFEDAEAVTGSQWKERDFNLRLNSHDAQLFWNGFQSNQPTLSINYTFFAKLYSGKSNTIETVGREEFKEAFEGLELNDSTQITLKEVIVNSGAVPIYINTQTWPDLIRQIDVNEQIPPDYAALDLYCFDFNNSIRDDLYAKRVEVKATSVGGRTVTAKKTFKSTAPEVYAQAIQFINAVKLSEPYTYRITEIYQDGNYTKSDWQERTSWNEILDVTTKSTHK